MRCCRRTRSRCAACWTNRWTSSSAAAPGRCCAALAEAWAAGDLQTLERYAQWCECADTDEQRAWLRRLNDDRNPQLAAGIDALHARGHKVFAAVGALHMTGAQALPRLLQQRGYQVQRGGFVAAQAAEHNAFDTLAATRSDMIDANAFTKLVPGFDFLQNLMQGAGQAAPAMGQWIAPTLDPAELEKRIGELKTVQFWLEQNARMIGMTVQALEVQRMTLSTLQTMNLPMADLRQALTLPTAGRAARLRLPCRRWQPPRQRRLRPRRLRLAPGAAAEALTRRPALRRRGRAAWTRCNGGVR